MTFAETIKLKLTRYNMTFAETRKLKRKPVKDETTIGTITF
jgi:hypothetical protein